MEHRHRFGPRFFVPFGLLVSAIVACGSSGADGSTNNPSDGSGAGGTGGGSLAGGGSATGSNAVGGSTAGSSTQAEGSAAGGSTAGGNAGGSTAGGNAAGGSTASTGGLIQNDVFWKDTSGTPIYSQSGNVIKVGGTYYWYGNKYNGAVAYAAKPTQKSNDESFAAVTCYSSTDLVSWKFENDVLVPHAVPGAAAADWFGRMGVAYNAATKKYVLIMEYIPSGGATAELFATSSTPTGAFTFDHFQDTLQNVANGAPGDQTVFTDDDGQAYLILSSSNGRSNLYVAPLRPSDFLNVEPATRIAGGSGREGNCMFKYNGRYYFNSSDLHGWNASHTYTISAANIMGPYSAESVMAGTDPDFSHVTQTGFFITVSGASGTTVIFAGDRWSDFAGNGIGYNQWVPLTFKGTAPQFQSLSQWSLDVVAGTWAVGPGNNYALNPSFEADRVTITQPAGWVTSTSSAGTTPYTNVTDAHSGRWKWRLTDTTSYEASIAQTLTGLPNGTYTLSAWMQSSGGQSVAQLFARNFGATEKDASVNSAIAAWKQVSVPGIVVSNGTCQIGAQTTANANQWLDLDDVVFVKD